MKKLFLTAALMLAMSISGSAQLLNVGSIEKVAVPADFSIAQAVISPDGAAMAVSTNDNALKLVSLADGKVSNIAESASINNLQFSDDSRNVVFRKVSFDKKLRYTSVVSKNLNTGKSTTLVKPTRQLNGFAVEGNTVATVENTQFRAKSLNGAVAAAAPVASIYYGQLMVTVNGITKAINPNGKQGRSYLWPSISPDGTKVLYFLVGGGCYVCNLDGSNAQFVASLRAPRWLDNATIIGMDDRDNGHEVLASSIVAVDLKGTKQVLTDTSVIAMYPSASANGSKIAFTTLGGEAYIININR